MKHEHNVRISSLSFAKIPALSRLFAEAVSRNFGYFPEWYQREIVREHSAMHLLLGYLHPSRIILTARDADRNLVGYAIGRAFRGGTGQIYWLYVDPSFRGRNTGLSLLAQMLRSQERKGAHAVSLATHDYRRYYERQGFNHHSQIETHGVPMDIMMYQIKQP
jgi:ribosomal protein S18 acetylase RimI-like enzyme